VYGKHGEGGSSLDKVGIEEKNVKKSQQENPMAATSVLAEGKKGAYT